MASAWSSSSSKVIAHPPYANAACRRRYGNGTGCSGAFIPHMVDQRKQEVLGVHGAEVTPSSQTHTESRSALCPQATETPKNTPKPDSVTAAQRRSAAHGTAARRNTLPRPSSRPSMTWGFLKTGSVARGLRRCLQHGRRLYH